LEKSWGKTARGLIGSREEERQLPRLENFVCEKSLQTKIVASGAIEERDKKVKGVSKSFYLS